MPAIMIQGCTSDAGKSTVVAGLCRILHRRGISVAPFKPQNMALNSAVTIDGGEIGRAQAVQAYAAGLEPQIDMNPILLKPNTDKGAQVIVQGFAHDNMEAVEYHEFKAKAMHYALDSYRKLEKEYGLIIIEGAGSPAEINLRENDIANMGFAEAIDCPVILVADIDRGGVFAHLVGTTDILEPSEQERIAGYIINRFRGDIALLESGIDWLEDRMKRPVFGVLPYLHNLHLEAEDAITANQNTDASKQTLNIIVPVIPRISNHTDFDVLRLHPQVDLQYIPLTEKGLSSIPSADVIILPGTKSVRDDLAMLVKNGWKEAIDKHLRYGGKVIGVCGGYQMLGKKIHDPDGIEGEAGTSEGLGLLDFETTLKLQKTLKKVTGKLAFNNEKISGYEIHAGITQGPALDRPAIFFEGSSDGVISENNHIFATYLHGLFDEKEALNALLLWAGIETITDFDYQKLQNDEINRLADMMEASLDIDALLNTIK